MSNVFDKLPPIDVEIELTTQEQDYLAGIGTGSVAWTGTPSPLVSIIRKLQAANREAHEEMIAQARHEAATEEHAAAEDGLWHPLHDRPEERDGLR